MKRALFALAVAASTGAALVACDSILGIDEFPDLTSDAGGGSDATIDGASDASVDRAEPDVAAGDDAADAPNDGQYTTPCVHPCVVGESRCLAGGNYETCIGDDAGCEQYEPFTCTGGATCWGPPGQAYCCSGTVADCAPSCHAPATGNVDGGNGQTNCGASGSDNCCTTLDVEGGTFLRSYDGVRNTDNTNPATVSTFALDKYEVTVGRFRAFVDAIVPTYWTPAPGAGVHTHLNGGMGLVDSSGDGGTYEPGWDPSLDSYVQMTQVEWDTALQCASDSTWTTSPGTMEAYPANCVTWEAAYAFCIWDGGFLPSETEWNYAASGGSQQRLYAWSSPPMSTTVDCSYANYKYSPSMPCVGGPTLVGAEPNGNGKWGQSDLTGNIYEWTLDFYAAYVSPCIDCGYLSNTNATNGRTLRGADWSYSPTGIFVSTRDNGEDVERYADNGVRRLTPMSPPALFYDAPR